MHYLRTACYRFGVSLCIVGGLLASASSLQSAAAEEWEESSPYYEDDAWYDVSEWFDGNDYNPTDETFGRWDDETYDSDAADYDYDDDSWYYGYNDVTDDDDWFYDYWGSDYYYYPSTRAGTYDHASVYRDYDNDGSYDAYVSFYDWDNDGTFEDVNTYDLNPNADRKSGGAGTAQSKQSSEKTAQKSAAQKDSGKSQSHQISSRKERISGSLKAKKLVDVRGKKHVVVQIEGDGRMTSADLGPAKALESLKLNLGANLTVEGPLTKVGDKQVLLAQSLTAHGKTQQLDRSPRRFAGTIVDTREIKVRDKQHKLVVLKTADGKQRLVDLGPSDRLPNVNIAKNAKLTVRGIPFKRNDRPVVLAVSIESTDTTAAIDRGTRS